MPDNVKIIRDSAFACVSVEAWKVAVGKKQTKQNEIDRKKCSGFLLITRGFCFRLLRNYFSEEGAAMFIRNLRDHVDSDKENICRSYTTKKRIHRAVHELWPVAEPIGPWPLPTKVDVVQCIVCLQPIGAWDAWRPLTSVEHSGVEPRSYAKGKYDS